LSVTGAWLPAGEAALEPAAVEAAALGLPLAAVEAPVAGAAELEALGFAALGGEPTVPGELAGGGLAAEPQAASNRPATSRLAPIIDLGFKPISTTPL